MRRDERPVMVGVGHDHDGALEYAAAEAGRRDCGVELVLAVHSRWPQHDGMDELRLVGDELVNVQAALLGECQQKLESWTHGEVSVSTRVVQGVPSSSLIEAARGAQLVVLQRHPKPRPFHIPTLSVLNAVASRASAPVVAVPGGWHEAQRRWEDVVAAVEDARSGVVVARAAFEAARRAGTSVRLVRAWSYVQDPDLDDPLLATLPSAERSRHLKAEITDGFAGLRGEYPEVTCSMDVVHGQAAYALVTASTDARLLVIGRHHPSLPFGSHLGPVTRAVLASAGCPVLVVDPSDT